MPTFIYRARNKEGSLIKGFSDAVDTNSLATRLRGTGYSILSIETRSEWTNYYKALWQKVRGIKYQEVIFFTRQLSTLLASGISLDVALESLAEQIKNPRFKQMIKDILSDVEAGLSLSDALMKYPRVFNQVYTSMIKVAEAAGILDRVLERLAQLGLRNLEIRSRLRAALAYPTILVGISICVVSYLLIAVVPRFLVIFSSYGLRLPLATRLLINVSSLVRYFWFIAIIALVGGILFLRRYLKSSQGRYNIDAFMLKIPIFGDFYLKVILTHFAHTLSSLIKSGVAILEALSVTQRTIKNSVINRVVQDIRLDITEGKSIVEPFTESRIFPPMVIQMVSAGEKTGKLDQMLSEIANFYDQEIEYAIRNISSILEPILLLIMGIMVAFIALGILLPIFNLVRVFR